LFYSAFERCVLTNLETSNAMMRNMQQTLDNLCRANSNTINMEKLPFNLPIVDMKYFNELNEQVNQQNLSDAMVVFVNYF